MKRLLILLILLIASTSFAQAPELARLSPAIVGGGVPAAGASETIGWDVTDRAGVSQGYTIIHPTAATISGNVWKIEIWTTDNINAVEFASFHVTGANTLSTVTTASANITGGSKQTLIGGSEYTTFAVAAGDYLGFFVPAGTPGIERTTSVTTGIWNRSGDNIPCTSAFFTADSTSNYSITFYISE